MAQAQAKADVDPNFETQVKELQQQNQQLVPEALKGAQPKWLMPKKEGWSGDLFDWEGMHKAFNRDKSNEDFKKAIEDAKSPGTTGDLAVTTTQIDILAVMERAFRARHTMGRPRAFAHAMARRKGHGNDKGPLVQCQLEYVRGLVKESRS